MSHVAYLDRQFVPHLSAAVHIEDRGYQLADGVYEVAEAKAASEAFLTSTSAELLPVVKIGGAPVGCGVPGPVSCRLRELYLAHAAAAA